MIPYTAKTHIKRDDTEAENILVMLNGKLEGLLLEAKAGVNGYVVRYRTDDSGKPIIRDDSIGSVETETIHGVVEFFTGDPR